MTAISALGRLTSHPRLKTSLRARIQVARWRAKRRLPSNTSRTLSCSINCARNSCSVLLAKGLSSISIPRATPGRGRGQAFPTDVEVSPRPGLGVAHLVVGLQQQRRGQQAGRHAVPSIVWMRYWLGCTGLPIKSRAPRWSVAAGASVPQQQVHYSTVIRFQCAGSTSCLCSRRRSFSHCISRSKAFSLWEVPVPQSAMSSAFLEWQAEAVSGRGTDSAGYVVRRCSADTARHYCSGRSALFLLIPR